MSELSRNLRSRVLETLALIASEDSQREYQKAVPHVDVPAELFNQWGDVYFPDGDAFQSGFSAKELEILGRFDKFLNQVCDGTPQQLPPLEEFVQTVAWRTLAAAAYEALSDLTSPHEPPA
ncbi:MAG TPA: hypothetical protein PK156_47150 [Polyangium sp.]|nr:hypothetical protein [Polyangium sp.]